MTFHSALGRRSVNRVTVSQRRMNSGIVSSLRLTPLTLGITDDYEIL